MSRPRSVHKLGRNRQGYRGETIRIERVMEQILTYANRGGWQTEKWPVLTDAALYALTRHATGPGNPRRRIYVSAGIHGDEPAGPMAVLTMLQQDNWPQECDLYLCPCLNPTGFTLNQREGRDGIDLNRDYRGPKTPEVSAHLSWLRQQPDFDAAFLLHEDWEADGFYLYELSAVPSRSVANEVIGAVSEHCPILKANRIDGWKASNGIVRPKADPDKRPDWPEAIYLFQEKTDLSCTFEAPSDYPLEVRIQVLVSAVRAALKARRSV